MRHARICTGSRAGIVLDTDTKADELGSTCDRRRKRSRGIVGSGRERHGVRRYVAKAATPPDRGYTKDGRHTSNESEEGNCKHCC